MNLHRPVGAVPLSQDARDNIARVQEIWSDCRGAMAEPFLFGGFGGADAMYAPVVHRFRTYAIEVTPDVQHLHGGDAGPAGVSAVDPRRTGRNPCYREVRNGVNLRDWQVGRGQNFRLRLAAETALAGCTTRPEPEPRACGTAAEIRARGHFSTP